MKSFIDLCVSDILKKHTESLSDTTIVFPSKRAIVFFKKSIGKQISRPIFLPQTTTIQDFCITQQKALIPSDFDLVYQLYHEYKKTFDTKESFEDFYQWGEMLLSDFDDIDKYCINANALFTNIGDIKDIDHIYDYLSEEQKKIIERFWNTVTFDNANSHDVRHSFINFWGKLATIYNDFKATLTSQNMCYEGMAMRSVVEASINEKDKLFGKRTYIFIGFNALSTCETEIFKFLKNRGQAHFYWDYDTYYKNDSLHEAGLFIRKNIELFPNELTEDVFTNFVSEKNITLVETPNEIAQTKYCSSLLQKYEHLDDTALILADEKLIIPIMKAIPRNIRYNITLGYPIQSSAAYTLFESLLDLALNIRDGKFFFKDVLKICESPLLPSKLQEDASKLRNTINKNKKFAISPLECSEICNIPEFFSITNNTDTYLSQLCNAITSFCLRGSLNAIDKSIFYTIYSELQSLQKVIEKDQIQFSKIKFINTLLKRSLQGKTIAVEGEPLEGLQVMGILETRMLDFKNIIMTSVTDGNLPKTSFGSSFIPYGLRVAFGMPTIKEQSAMYSYYFYRLIQRCENLTLLYSETSGEGKSEKSRFIMQLLYESPFKILNNTSENKKFASPVKIKNGIHIHHCTYNISPDEKPVLQADKRTQEVQDYFSEIQTKRNLTPSHIIQFMQCGMKFYFSIIRNFKKPETLDETPQAFDMGNYFHCAMEKIYEPYEGKYVDEKIISSILANESTILNAIDFAMQEKRAPANVADRNSKEYQKVKLQIKKFLAFDKKNPFTIIGLEKQCKTLKFNGIQLGGIIDRLDCQNKTYRIIDYKTGKCDPSKIKEKLGVKDMEDLFYDKHLKKEIFQTFFYSFVLKKQNPQENYQPNLMYIQSIDEHENNRTRITYGDTEIESFSDDLMQEFEAKLQEVLDSLLDRDTPFTQTNTPDSCKFCDFRQLCGITTVQADFS